MLLQCCCRSKADQSAEAKVEALADELRSRYEAAVCKKWRIIDCFLGFKEKTWEAR